LLVDADLPIVFLPKKSHSWIEKWTHSSSINIPYTTTEDRKILPKGVKEILSVPEKPLMFSDQV
jgi:hypothetical protein